MSEHPLMVLLLEQSSFLGIAEDIENDIMPLPNQLAFGPGDPGILVSANTPLEHEFCVVEGVDPEQHAEQYPDWEERVLNSYVLCEIRSKNDTDPYLGWVSRLKILPIQDEHYEETKTWRETAMPDELPDWTIEVYQVYADAISDQAPATVPHSVACAACGSLRTDLVVTRKATYQARVGSLMIEGKKRYLPVHEVEEKAHHVAKVHCTDCKHERTLSDEEWAFNN